MQTSNYDIYAKLLQLRRLQTYSPAPVQLQTYSSAPVQLQTYSPAPVLLTDYVTTGNGRENDVHRHYSIANFTCNFNLTVVMDDSGIRHQTSRFFARNRKNRNLDFSAIFVPFFLHTRRCSTRQTCAH